MNRPGATKRRHNKESDSKRAYTPETIKEVERVVPTSITQVDQKSSSAVLDNDEFNVTYPSTNSTVGDSLNDTLNFTLVSDPKGLPPKKADFFTYSDWNEPQQLNYPMTQYYPNQNHQHAPRYPDKVNQCLCNEPFHFLVRNPFYQYSNYQVHPNVHCTGSLNHRSRFYEPPQDFFFQSQSLPNRMPFSCGQMRQNEENSNLSAPFYRADDLAPTMINTHNKNDINRPGPSYMRHMSSFQQNENNEFDLPGTSRRFESGHSRPKRSFENNEYDDINHCGPSYGSNDRNVMGCTSFNSGLRSNRRRSLKYQKYEADTDSDS